ncbi:MAG: nucleoside recognition domain-containing protein, partial [Planctomycetota bacterium]
LALADAQHEDQALLGGEVTDLLPEGVLRDLLVDGVVGGIAGTVVFLPQICLLFFLLTLIEDTGYLARAACVANRLLRPFGLPGTAFVPLLSSHACAIPGIICTRLIPDRRDRLATILVAPFVSCSARIPVYTLLIGVLFAGRPAWQGGLAFAGCYLLGGVAALLTALLFRRTLLRGRSRPMLLELPPYRRPSLRNAALTAWDRGRTFLVKAGTVILLISIVLWWMSTYPGTPTSPEVLELRTRAEAAADATAAEQLAAQADRLEGRESLAGSYSGRIGRTVEPILSPIGADWQLSIAVLSSFSAREGFVSALTVTLGAGDDIDDSGRVREIVASARRDDGSPLLDPAAAASLLVFFVLAMQCLPTLAVTSREAGGWRWAALQFGYMSVVAWFLAWLTHGIVGGGA